MTERVGPFFEDFLVGQEIVHAGEEEVSRERFNELVKCLGYDDQPIHFDPEDAKSKGFRDVILPGPIVYNLVFRLTRRDVSWDIINLGTDALKHLKPVYPEDILRARSTVIEAGKWDGRAGDEYGLVRVKTIGVNQGDVSVIEFERSVLNPYRKS